jgi:coproporphyrinogen III oxidase-like Fe-S oxidoreductase
MPATISAILDSIHKRFLLDDGAEVTMEMDPGTFDLDYLVAVRDAGTNRVSLGMQSFDDRVLALLGRVYRSADVHLSVEIMGMALACLDLPSRGGPMRSARPFCSGQGQCT